jgi:hypothetical protein
MITFKEFLAEMAAPRDSDRAKTYYHGTSSEKAGQSILKNGIEPGDIALPERQTGKKGPNLDPVKGKVYITPDLRYAQMYAIGGDMAGSDWKPKGQEYGYLFEIGGNDLEDIQPDEDSIGEMATLAYRGDKHKAELQWLVRLAMSKLTAGQWRKLVDGEYTMWAHTGKKLLPLMSDAQKLQLIELGAHVAHTGKLIPKAAYRIDLNRIKELKRDASNFFDVAEKVK